MVFLLILQLQQAFLSNSGIWSRGQHFYYGYGYGYLPLVEPVKSLFINEFQSHPISGEQEWIELYNPSEYHVELEGCHLSDAVGVIHQFSASLLKAKHFQLVSLQRSKLNNSGDTISLVCSDQLIDQVAYGNHSSESYYPSKSGYDQGAGYLPAPKQGQSLARFPDAGSIWFRFGIPKPAEANTVENNTPQAMITLQGSKKTAECSSLSLNVTGEDSFDPDGDVLSFTWEYKEASSLQILHESNRENPLSFRFESVMGTDFLLELTISDPFGGIAQASLPIKLGVCERSASATAVAQKTYQYSADIIINELFPNPVGADSGVEFVELWNKGQNEVKLDGWKLGGKYKKSLEGQKIATNNFLILRNITLKNSGDLIQLLDPSEQIVSQVEYPKSEEGKSWSRKPSTDYSWTVPTPLLKNDFPFQKETIYLQASAPVIITQVLPNPDGADKDHEWMEILNRSEQVVDLSGWFVDNREGGSKPYVIEDLSLSPGETHRFSSSQTGISLRNSADQARLLNPAQQEVDVLEWHDPAVSGQILTRNQLVRDLSIDPELAQVSEVIDGDTIDVSIQTEAGPVLERVRMIGVDTPESVHPFKPLEYFGKEASEYSKNQLSGRSIRLEYDLSKRGKYGRLLAYVWYEDDHGNWQHFNAELIQKGYAFAYLRYPFRYREEFRQLQLRAEQEKQGLWKSEDLEQIRAQQKEVIDEELEELATIEELLEELQEIEEEEPDEPDLVEEKEAQREYDQTGWDSIKLNEVLPNPAGKDSEGGEYIELINTSEQKVDLLHWAILNQKEKPLFQFDESEFILGKEHPWKLLTPRASIKNSSETLYLMDPLGVVRDQFSYEDSVKDDQAWYRNPLTQKWQLGRSTANAQNPWHLKAQNDRDRDGLEDDTEASWGMSNTSWDSDEDGLPDDFEVLHSKGFVNDYDQYLYDSFSVSVKQTKRTLTFSGSSRPYTNMALKILPEGTEVKDIPVDTSGEWIYKIDVGVESGGHRFVLWPVDFAAKKGREVFIDLTLENRLNASKLPKKAKWTPPKPLYIIRSRPLPWHQSVISAVDWQQRKVQLEGAWFPLASQEWQLQESLLKPYQEVRYQLAEDQQSIKVLQFIPAAHAASSGNRVAQSPLASFSFLLVLLLVSLKILRKIHAPFAPGVTAQNTPSTHKKSL